MRGVVLLSLFCVCYSAPTLSVAETLDVDTNAQIDHVRLVFDSDMDDTSFVLSEWTVATYNVEAVVTCLLPFAACGENDTEVFLLLTEKGTPDTGATPTVAYAGPSTKDILAQSLAPMSGHTTVDKAPPVVIMAEGAVGSRSVRIVMSEPVMSTRPGGGFNFSDFQYQNRFANGSLAQGLPTTGPLTYQGAEEFVPGAPDLDGSDGVLVINADQPLQPSDFGWDSVSARNYRVLDYAGVTAAMNAKLVQQNSVLDEPEESSAYSGYTLALGIVLLVLFLCFIFGSLAWWWSKRSEASSVSPDTGDAAGGGSVPDRSRGTPAGTAKSPESNTIELANKGATALLPGMTAKDVLNKYDENHDGVIDKQELGHMIHDARAMHGQIDPAGAAPNAASPTVAAPEPDASDRNKQMLRDDDDTKPPDDGVSDIKFDL